MLLAIEESGTATTDESARCPTHPPWPLREKIVAETSMLLVCLEPIRNSDPGIREDVEQLARLLIPLARHDDVLASICLEPGLARDHAVGHVLLSRLGYPDPDVDALLSKCLAMGEDFGPERLPHRRLEQAWLCRMWRGDGSPMPRDSGLITDSMLGRALDALGCTRLDIYALTHAAMYASDLGTRRIRRTRPRAAISADADAALAYSLEANDFDLTAEVLMIWPMLGLPWSPASVFSFGILGGEEDKTGFLPGLAFDPARYETLTGSERTRFALATSYHAAYVMGFLCAIALRKGRMPPALVPKTGRPPGATAAILALLGTHNPTACWRRPLAALDPGQQESVAPLLLTMLLRQARQQGDLRLVRKALEVALAHDLVAAPASVQAAALLRRSLTLRL